MFKLYKTHLQTPFTPISSPFAFASTKGIIQPHILPHSSFTLSIHVSPWICIGIRLAFASSQGPTQPYTLQHPSSTPCFSLNMHRNSTCFCFISRRRWAQWENNNSHRMRPFFFPFLDSAGSRCFFPSFFSFFIFFFWENFGRGKWFSKGNGVWLRWSGWMYGVCGKRRWQLMLSNFVESYCVSG